MQSSCAQGGPKAFEQGMAALLAGNCADAYCLWCPLSDQGRADVRRVDRVPNHPIVASLDEESRVRVVGQRGDWLMVVLPARATADEDSLPPVS